MTTYNVRADGTQGTALSATGDISDPANAMTLATFTTAINASSFSSNDIISISGRGGEHTGTATMTIAVDSISIIGENGYRPIINLTGANDYRFRFNNCTGSLLENMEIYDGSSNNVEWTGTGNNHVIRNVHSHTAGNAAYSNELETVSGLVTCYDIIGSNCGDDGWSSHGGGVASQTIIYGGNFYGNDEGINIVSNAVLTCYDVRSFGNTEFDFGATATGLDAIATFYDSEFGGGVICADQINTTATLSFYRCKFHCNAKPTTAGFTTACIHFAKNPDRTVNLYMEACEFLEPPAGSHQLLIYGNTSTATIKKCSFHQIAEIGTGLWFTTSTSGANVVSNCNFYNCLNGIIATTNCTITNCNFDSCTADVNGTASSETGTTTDSSGFKQVAIGDFRLASGSALIGAGSDSTIVYDVTKRAYETNDVGCYADTDTRPLVKGIRPSS